MAAPSMEKEIPFIDREVSRPGFPPKKNRSNMQIPIFLNETEFRIQLVRERKRSDRTKNPLLLALVDVSVLDERGMGNHLMHGKIIEGLETCSRDIDLRGWYNEHLEIGVLFNDIRLEAVEGILEKLTRCIKNVLGENLYKAITVRHIVYPLNVATSPLVSSIEHSILYPEMEFSNPATRFQRAMKRLTDVMVTATALIVLTPLFAVIAALIKFSSPGPVLYRQERLGFGGKRFNLLKFRSMKPNCETGSHKAYVLSLIKGTAAAGDTGFYKIGNDPRITKIGQILRKTSLDELPQLWNVLKGDMSLVGPRPPIPYEVEAYAPWHQRRLLEAIPGITGPWQIEGRSRTTFDEMVRMDIRYSSSWSFWLDLKLLCKTPVAVLIGKGAS